MSRRSYAQYCGLARALDVVGERWSLLIVRELLLGPARYTQLASALPGVASNLLADRLRGLVSTGVVERLLDPNSNSVAYALTPWGAELREPVDALVRWSTPLMRSRPGDDTFRGRWLAVALCALLHGRTSATPITVGLDADGALMAVQLDGTGPTVVLDPDPLPSTVLRAAPEVVLALAAGAMTVDQALARGSLDGEHQALAAIFAAADNEGATRPPRPT